jgi:hypothetical protein
MFYAALFPLGPRFRSRHGLVRHKHTFSLTPMLNTSLVHRDARYFSPAPEQFWPERWLPGEGPKIAEARGQDFSLNQTAYMPFNYGSLSAFPAKDSYLTNLSRAWQLRRAIVGAA